MTDLSEYEFSRKENIVFYSCLAAAGLIISYLMYRNILFSVVIIPFARRIKGFVTERQQINTGRRPKESIRENGDRR